MNIYNKLFVLANSIDPIREDWGTIKCWYLKLSNNKYHYYHRDFDLPSYINGYCIIWHQYNKFHRLIGPAFIQFKDHKSYYLRDNRDLEIS